MDIGELLINLRDHPPKDYIHRKGNVSEACGLESDWEESLKKMYDKYLLSYGKVSQVVECMEVKALQDPIIIRKLVLFFIQHMH